MWPAMASASDFLLLEDAAAPGQGFAVDDPAMDLLLCKQWGVIARLPAEFALRPTLVKDVVTHFKLAAPIVALLNTPLIPKPRKPLF